MVLSQVSSSVSLHQLRLSKEIILLVLAVKRARDESTPDDGKWHRGWRQLGDNNRWKQFGDYWRKQDVEKTRDSLSISLAYEESGEENPEYRLPLDPLTNNKIIVRDCYKSFYDRILKLRNDGYTGLVLTGQPGTGVSSS
jgi:hypothetical protein